MNVGYLKKNIEQLFVFISDKIWLSKNICRVYFDTFLFSSHEKCYFFFVFSSCKKMHAHVYSGLMMKRRQRNKKK